MKLAVVAISSLLVVGLDATRTKLKDALASCPTITSTTRYCGRCQVPGCLGLKTIKRDCGCPTAVPTKYTTHDCKTKCPTGCRDTLYVFQGPSTSCSATTTTTKTATTTTTTTTTSEEDASSCVPTVTITTRPGIEGGCGFNCSSDFCILDQFVTLPCGCTTAPGVVTRTVTACATASPCWNCHTGFPFTTTRSDCPRQTQ
jgi:hypothetical protein